MWRFSNVKHTIELTEDDVRQAIVEHINHSDLGVLIRPDQISFRIVDYGESFEGAFVDLDS
jgi:cell division protein FtsB